MQGPAGGEDTTGTPDRAEDEQTSGIQGHVATLHQRCKKSRFRYITEARTMGVVNIDPHLLLTVIGYLGAVLLLSGFAASSTGRVAAGSGRYQVANLLQRCS